EDVEIRGIPLVSNLQLGRADLAGIGSVLVLVYGRPHLPEHTAQFRLARPLRADPGQRHDRRREDHDDRRDDEELDEGVALRLAQTLAQGRPRISHCCTVMVTGLNCRPIAVPPGPVAEPLSVSVTDPGPTASNSTTASRPVPVAPIASAP